MTRPRGSPPIPSAISSPSEPVEITSISDAASREPSFMIEPLPKARSIWPSAASKARCLSIMSLSKRRNAVCMASHPILFHTEHARATRGGQDHVPGLFARQVPDAHQASAVTAVLGGPARHNPKLSCCGELADSAANLQPAFLHRLYYNTRIPASWQQRRFSEGAMDGPGFWQNWRGISHATHRLIGQSPIERPTPVLLRRVLAAVAADAQIGLLLVAPEALDRAEAAAIFADHRARLRGFYLLIGAGLQELADPQPAGIAGRTLGRQRMVGAYHLVAVGDISLR